MDEYIHTGGEGYTKSRSIKEGWQILWWVLRYTYPLVLKDSKEKLKCTGKPLIDIYREIFWLALSGYEVDF